MILNAAKAKNFDDFLDNHIHFGRSQVVQFLILAWIDFLDGFAYIMLAVLASILKKNWELT